MRLEDEIKTKGFKSEYHKLSINLIYTYNWLTAISQAEFGLFGITMQQFNILRILMGQYPTPCTIQLLKARMLDKQSDASRLVDRLVAKGLVQREPCTTDRRKMDVLISKKGLDLLEEIDPVMQKLDDTLSGLSVEEAKTLNDLMDKVRDGKPN